MESVKPYLLPATAAGLPDTTKQNSATIWRWLNARLTAPEAQEDLRAVEQNPYNQIRFQMVALHLQELLESDEAAVSELAALLPPAPPQ
jgi:hypothetical protein